MTSPLGQTLPSVAMDANGDYVVAWNNQVHLAPIISTTSRRASTIRPGSPRRARSSSPRRREITRPSVAMDANGDFVVAYQVLNTSTYLYGISAQRFNLAGTPQGSTMTINDGSSR